MKLRIDYRLVHLLFVGILLKRLNRLCSFIINHLKFIIWLRQA